MPGVYPLGQTVDALKKTYWGFFNSRLTWPNEISLTAYSKEFACVIMIMISFLHATFYSSMIPTATMIKDDPLGVEASPGNFVPLTRRDGDEMVCSFLLKFKECLQNQEDMTLLMKAKSNVRFLIHFESDEGKTLAAAFHRRDVEDAEAERLGHSPLKMAREYYSIHSWLVSCGLGGNAKDISDFLTTHNATDNPEKSNADVIKRHLLFFKRFYNCSVPGEACDPLDGCTFRSSLTRYPEYCKTRCLITSESCLIFSESAIAI